MNKLRLRRLKKLMTQRELAEKSGITQTTISLTECEHSRPENITLAKLANALGCDIEDLREDGGDDDD